MPPGMVSRVSNRRTAKCVADLKEGWYYVFVVALLVVMLLHFKRESHAPFYATALLLVLNQIFNKEQRWTRHNNQISRASTAARLSS